MSETAHTPGPWTHDGPPDNVIVWSGPESRICFMTSNGPSEANAQLISSAPELLEALKGAQLFLAGLGHNLPQIAEAIARAEGRQS